MIMKKNILKWTAFIFILFSIGTMIFPNAYVMHWMSPPDSNEIWTSAYSYFSSIPYGYANFFPLLTAVGGIFAALFHLIANASSKLIKPTLMLTCVSVGFSLLALLMSYSISLAGMFISVFMLLSVVLQCFYLRIK